MVRLLTKEAIELETVSKTHSLRLTARRPPVRMPVLAAQQDF
jgi:hypothetical protein